MQTQLNFDLSKPHAPPFPGSGIGATHSERAAIAIRAELTFEEMRAERQAISDRALSRHADGDRTGLGGPLGHQDCGSPFSVFDWMTDVERQRFHLLGLALPTTGEDIEAAKLRIQLRIAARKRKASPPPA